MVNQMPYCFRDGRCIFPRGECWRCEYVRRMLVTKKLLVSSGMGGRVNTDIARNLVQYINWDDVMDKALEDMLE